MDTTTIRGTHNNRSLIIERFQRRVDTIEHQLAQPAPPSWLVQVGQLYVAHAPEGVFLTGAESAYCYPTRLAAIRTARHVKNGNHDRGVAIDRHTALAIELIFAQALLDNLLATTGE